MVVDPVLPLVLPLIPPLAAVLVLLLLPPPPPHETSRTVPTRTAMPLHLCIRMASSIVNAAGPIRCSLRQQPSDQIPKTLYSMNATSGQ